MITSVAAILDGGHEACREPLSAAVQQDCDRLIEDGADHSVPCAPLARTIHRMTDPDADDGEGES